jgi:hypothetical protein
MGSDVRSTGCLTANLFLQKKGSAMKSVKFVGINLHKTTISVCVVDGKRDVLARRRLYCAQPESIVAFFNHLGEFQMVAGVPGAAEPVQFVEHRPDLGVDLADPGHTAGRPPR